MTIQEFKAIFEEDIVMVESGAVNTDTSLEELEDWDSMAYVSLNAALDEHYGFTLNAQELKSLKTFSHIVQEIEKRKQS